MSDFEYFLIVGNYFGYPLCCIKTFYCNYHRNFPTEEQKKAGNGSGFIPCVNHAKKILSGEITLESLIVNRQHKKKFPEMDDAEFFKFKNNL